MPTAVENASPTRIPWAVRIVPPVWGLMFIGIAAFVNTFYPWREIIDLRSHFIAVLCITIGVADELWAAIIFFRKGTEIIPASRTNKLLLVKGLYTISRNPMYLGMTLGLLGVAFWVGTLPFFLVPIAFFCMVNFVFIPFEEAKMLRQFGEQYEEYRRKVPRWIVW